MYKIVHESRGRLRYRPLGKPAPYASVSAWLAENLPSGVAASVSARTGSVLVLYASNAGRESFETAFAERFGMFTAVAAKTPKSSLPVRRGDRNAVTEPAVRNPIPGKLVSYLFPRAVRYSVAALRSVPYMLTGFKELFRGRLGLNVLDGAALLVCLLRRDFASVSSITFFFALGEYLADWTRKKSRASLEESLALNIDMVWVRTGDLERQVHISEVEKDDLVVVRSGAVFPVDGTVAEGDGMVNQASMTGETMPSHKKPGSSVYAGTVLEEGTLVVRASRVGGDTRIRSIIRTIEDSETAKATIQSKYEHMADAIVPYNFLLGGAVFAATRNAVRASSVLMVDYSCAIRLSTPLCIFTAMRQAADQGVLIKGGKYMEALDEATAVIFDKTGTLTEAKPELVDVVPFGARSRNEVLRLSACLEEHFAHPVGQAVVRAADAEGLKHREEHAEVQYVVAHGIASRWNGQDVVIGSEHFVREDRGIVFTAEQQKTIDAQASLGRSVLYLGMGGELAGILLIEDKIREETPAVVQRLRETGVKRVLMLTGDGGLTAASIAARAGIDEYRSGLLPEQKSEVVEELKRQGYKVLMVGDGINDSPALSAADVGVAMGSGADIAREVADVVLVNGRLDGLLLARSLSRKALKKVRNQFIASVVLNSAFLVGGLLAFITPAMSALLHNASTAAIALTSIQGLPVGRKRPSRQQALPAHTDVGGVKAVGTEISAAASGTISDTPSGGPALVKKKAATGKKTVVASAAKAVAQPRASMGVVTEKPAKSPLAAKSAKLNGGRSKAGKQQTGSTAAGPTLKIASGSKKREAK